MESNSKHTKGDQKFTTKDVDIQAREFAYKGFFKIERLALRHRLFEGGWSKTINRELFVRGSAVAALMYDPVNKLIGFVEQFRIGAINDSQGPWLCEVVAGMTEPGEEPKDVILRELIEEANMTPRQLIPICEYYTSPGGTSELITLFCAICDLRDASGIYGLEEESEDIRVRVLPQQEVFDGIYSGLHNNGASLICLQWLMMNYLTLDENREEV